MKPLGRDADTLEQLAYRRAMARIAIPNSVTSADEFLKSERPAFMTQVDYEELVERARTIKAAADDERRFSALLPCVEDLLDGASLPTSHPDYISSDEWADLKRIEQNIVTAEKDNKRRQAELDQQEAETKTLKVKVLRQLEVIDTFIRDPGVVDRIEEYEGVFAPGNLANLKSLAALRREHSA